ncbi:MAG: glycerate kinase [Pseudonocardiales bacterium]|nr:glycerate kinase [Pseudonocardiales bacterium]
MSRPRLLALPDKFRGTATAAEVAAEMCRAGDDAGWTCAAVPVSDGGEGLLDCLGGANRVAEVTGPLGAPVRAGWRLADQRAVIEMAAASGLALVAGHNDPLAATTAGTGELVLAAIEAGARHIVVGVGGSATTDGGAGAVEILAGHAPLDGSRGYSVVVAVDVQTRFLDAAATFAPQKGADRAQVDLLAVRLQDRAAAYRSRFGMDVTTVDGGGAAGGLAGGLAALGAPIRPGFELVAAELGLSAKIRDADLVLTGEGRLDRTSLAGKAPYAVLRMCERLGTPVRLVVGDLAPDVEPPPNTVALVARFGRDAALNRARECIRAATAELLADVQPWIS